MAKIEGIGYVPQTKVRIPNRNSYSPLELMLYHQKRKEKIPNKVSYSTMELSLYLQQRNERLPTSKQWSADLLEAEKHGCVRMSTSREWSQILLEAEKNFPNLAKDMVSGDVEVQASIIAWPNKNGDYAGNVSPGIGEGRYPVLLEGFTVKGTNDNYTLEGGTRTPLKDFPKSPGNLDKPIDELGLPERAYVWSDSDFEYEQGLRSVLRGDWSWPHDESVSHHRGRFDMSAAWGPLYRLSFLASRPIFDRADKAASQELKELVKAR